MSVLYGNQIIKNIDDSIPPLPSAKEFYDSQKDRSIEVQQREKSKELDRLFAELEETEEYNLTHRRKKKHPWNDVIIVHGRNCKCCTPPEIVKQNEQMREQKWKEIGRQRKLAKRISKGAQMRNDRWDREQENFVKWQLKWGFY